MKYRLLIGYMVVIALSVGCSKEVADIEQAMEYSSTAISFSADEWSADWESKASTRGLAVNNFDSYTSPILVYSFLNGTNDIYIDNKEATKSTDGYWGFSPAYYYLVDEELDFLAYTPAASSTNGLTQSINDSNEITFKYAAPTAARNQPDFMVATPAKECDSESPLDELTFNHVLTQISMNAMVGDEAYADRYVITRFTMHNITIEGELTYSVEDGIGTWTESLNGEFITSAMLPDESLGETPVKLTTTSQLIMNNGHTLFMIPQEIENKVGTAPTIQITITDTYPTTTYETDVDTDTQIEVESYLTYRTDKLTLPSPNEGAGWLQGQHVNLEFVFNIDETAEVIPLSFTAKLLGWVETSVYKEVDESIYAYLNSNSATNGEVTLYTNGVVTAVSDVGESYINNGDNSYTIQIGGAGTLIVKIANSDETTIIRTFTITE